MTDKQTIIDGVNVYGCVQFIQEEEDCCNLGGSCKGWPNCYYKQLARKTQECEELKNRKLKLELNENHNKNEIKKLKKRIRKDREFFKNKISSLTLARKEFLEALDHFNWQIGLVKNDRYRKALKEIEKATKINCEEICGRKFENCNDTSCLSAEVLDIINKAKK